MTEFDISPQAALPQIQAGQLQLIDLRSPLERRVGHIAPAQPCTPERLASFVDRSVPTVVMCARGVTSVQCVAALRDAGHDQVFNLAGGFAAWHSAGLPVINKDSWFERYQRQMTLPEVGESGQLKLHHARVALIGVGGLGCPAAQYLTAAGVGHLILIDPDRVERSNLHRQILHDDAAVGALKVDSARMRLLAMNPDLKLTTHAARLTAANASTMLDGADVIIDGSDNLDSREASNGYCVEAGVPLVYAAVEQWRGQLAVFDSQRAPEAGCYQCLFPAIGQAPAPRTCAEAGVIGVVPAVLGSLQASEAIKCIVDHDHALRGRLLSLELAAMRFRETQLHRDPQCPVCSRRSGSGRLQTATMTP